MRAGWLPRLVLVAIGLVVRPASGQGLQIAQGPGSTFLRGVPSGEATRDVITINVLDAIRRALQQNLGVLNAEDELGRARGARLRQMGDLLPNVSAHVTETRQKVNFQAFGFGTFEPALTGFPTLIGPFNVFDARIYLTQALIDLSARNHVRSEAHKIEAAQYSYQSAEDLVVWVTANLYLDTLAASARADAATTQRQTAEAIYNQSVDLKEAGVVAGIDVLRAQVQFNTEAQRASSAANEFEKAKLQLAHVIGLPLGQPFALDSVLPDLPTPDMTLDEAYAQAIATRPDYQAALARVHAAEAARQAISDESLPGLHVNADYGDIGLSPSDSHITYSVSGVVQIPIFQGGRERGKLLEADADLRTRRSELEDLKASIYYGVRTAFLDLQTTSEQQQVATRTRDLAAQQLAQARDRFGAGVADNIEVVQAQEAVAVATEQYISAVYGYDLAKGALLRGIGSTAATLRQLLGGTH